MFVMAVILVALDSGRFSPQALSVALEGHFAGGVPVPVLEAGNPGLDVPGDSLFSS
jgi:hypothetical protein